MPLGEIVQRIVWIALGSALGGNSRYWLGAWIQSRWGSVFPLGTLVINVSGAFAIGLLMSILYGRELIPDQASSPLTAQFLLGVGFLGAYTTFSAFEFENLMLIQSKFYLQAALYTVGSVAAGFVAVWLGALAGRQF